ncbi:amino acid/polyamine transporter I [Aspergillus pseudoustus]|uniref:Amino acid/polyamine transporter I n=1 Tax=Aspergillus pseudoustus TaxID=1810923 RepID=A0ABR4JF29_9EURO
MPPSTISFGLWSGISLGWLSLNAFGGISFILFVGLSAGGLPAILYGFIGSGIAMTCLVLTLAQCAARFSTAGGAYHYTCFLIPPQYRRQLAYPLGWLNYLGYIFTHAACCAIVATATLSLVNLCRPEFDVAVRWRLFLVYLAVVAICWLLNLKGLKSIPTLELIGCYITVLAFVVYTILLLVKAPKASARSVFVQPTNDTGYASTAFAILLGLLTSFSTLISCEAACHLAEELPSPKRVLPRILLIVIVSQVVVGVIWIIVLGFAIIDLEKILNTTTGIPVLELIRLATNSDAAAIGFAVVLLINNGTSALGSAVAMSRQGYAFARDGGLFWNRKLVERSTLAEIPVWSIHLPSFLVALIGFVYLFSDAAFNAIIGGQGVCMIISFASPALALLVTRRKLLPSSRHWNLGGVWATPLYIFVIGYAVLVTIVALIPQRHPVTALNMNYTSLVLGALLIGMALSWFVEGRGSYAPPLDTEEGRGFPDL